MAQKGRKDTGELYDVFRKITSEQSVKTPPEDLQSRSNESGEETPEETSRIAEQSAPDIGRAFIVSYNTAVITFVAFIIILIWIYLLGIERGEKKVIQMRSHEEAQNVKDHRKRDFSNIRLTKEMGTEKNLWSVEVYKIAPDKLGFLRKNIRDPLKRRKDVKETFIAKAEDGNGYVLWINTFPEGSIDGNTTLENMKNMESRAGGKAFPHARFVRFEKSRVIE